MCASPCSPCHVCWAWGQEAGGRTAGGAGGRERQSAPVGQRRAGGGSCPAGVRLRLCPSPLPTAGPLAAAPLRWPPPHAPPGRPRSSGYGRVDRRWGWPPRRSRRDPEVQRQAHPPGPGAHRAAASYLGASPAAPPAATQCHGARESATARQCGQRGASPADARGTLPPLLRWAAAARHA